MSLAGKVMDATIAAGGTTTSAIDLGRNYDKLSVMIPSMTSCTLQLMVAEREGGTYYNLGEEVTTSEGTFNRADVWTLGNWRFIKIKSSVVQPAAVTMRIFGIAE